MHLIVVWRAARLLVVLIERVHRAAARASRETASTGVVLTGPPPVLGTNAVEVVM
jgi:hypothetical protein